MKVLKIVMWIVTGLVVAAVVGLFLGLLVQALWNWLVPTLFGLPSITYWQAVGLLILCHLLFKGHNEMRAKPGPDGNGDPHRRFARRTRSMLSDGGEDAPEPGPARG